MASALSTALTIYLCQIRVHQRWQSKLQLPTARKKEWRPVYTVTAGSSPLCGYLSGCQHCDTHYFSGPTNLNFHGHVTSSVTGAWPFDSQVAISYWCSNLHWHQVIISSRCRDNGPQIYWGHDLDLSRDHSNINGPFPIDGPLEPSLYLQPLSR